MEIVHRWQWDDIAVLVETIGPAFFVKIEKQSEILTKICNEVRCTLHIPMLLNLRPYNNLLCHVLFDMFLIPTTKKKLAICG